MKTRRSADGGAHTQSNFASIDITGIGLPYDNILYSEKDHDLRTRALDFRSSPGRKNDDDAGLNRGPGRAVV